MYGRTRPVVSYRIWAAGELWAETQTFKEAQKEYTAALNLYKDKYRDSVYIEKVQIMEVIRGRYF